MKFFEEYACQKKKTGYTVSGDYFVCKKSEKGSVFILCDGIGSGVYANIAAITCAERLLGLLENGISLRSTCEMVASSMHKAREAEIPFSAFTVVRVLLDGRYSIYTYEAPNAIMIQNSKAMVLEPVFLNAGYEVIGEVFGKLSIGDSIFLFSDGVSQAGLGHGLGMGIGSNGVAKFINKTIGMKEDIKNIPKKVVDMCLTIMQGNFEDDTSAVLINCKEAVELSVLTGPPLKPSMDEEYVKTFMELPGQKIVCGSSTADIVSRVLEKKVKILNLTPAMGGPPEYAIEGIDVTTEGAIMLNSVYNILDEPLENFTQNSVVEYMCLLLLSADVIHFFIGTASNPAHEDIVFKQAGVKVRKTAVKLIIEKLRKQGKMVIARYY